jgi:hypothetical protein
MRRPWQDRPRDGLRPAGRLLLPLRRQRRDEPAEVAAQQRVGRDGLVPGQGADQARRHQAPALRGQPLLHAAGRQQRVLHFLLRRRDHHRRRLLFILRRRAAGGGGAHELEHAGLRLEELHVAGGLRQHVGGAQPVPAGDQPRQLRRLLADPLPARLRRRGLPRVAAAGAGVLLVRSAAHERPGLRRRDDLLGRRAGRRLRGHLLLLLAAGGGAQLLVAVLLLVLGGAGGVGGGGVAGGEVEQVVEAAGVGGGVVDESEQRVGDLGVEAVVVVEEGRRHVRRGEDRRPRPNTGAVVGWLHGGRQGKKTENSWGRRRRE